MNYPRIATNASGCSFMIIYGNSWDIYDNLCFLSFDMNIHELPANCRECLRVFIYDNLWQLPLAPAGGELRFMGCL